MLQEVKASYAVQKLAQVRDEIRVKIHLATADTRDRWVTLERRWNELEGRLKMLEDLSGEAAGEIRQVVAHLVEELGEGYKKIRQTL